MRAGATTTGRLIAALVLALAAPRAASAADLRRGFEAAAALDAELRSIEAQRAVVAARQARAAALLPGAPIVGAGYRSDHVTGNRGLREFEGEIDMPVWLPGESRSLREAAIAQAAALEARAARRRLLLAGEVRDAWWAWTIAGAEREAQSGRVALARALERDTARQVRAGQLPEADLDVATADLRDAEGALRTRDLAVRDAALAFRSLTGVLPSAGPAEAPAAGGEDDPRLAAPRAQVEAGRAAERLARVRDRANPEVGLQLRYERDAFGEPWGTRLLLRVSLPLQNPPAWREQIASARAEVTTASAELASAGRTVAGGVDRARAVRATALALVETTEARYAALARQARLYEESYRLGQQPLIEVVRVRVQRADADAARRRARAEAGRAESLLNQALGMLPR